MSRHFLTRSLLTAFIPLFYLPPLLLSLNSLPLKSVEINLTTYLGLLLTLSGLTLWINAFFTLGHSFQVLPSAQRLITAGPYRCCRHPLYLGIIITCLGLSLATQSLPSLLYTLYLLVPLSIVRAHYEDKTLAEKFLTAYSKYRESTLL